MTATAPSHHANRGRAQDRLIGLPFQALEIVRVRLYRMLAVICQEFLAEQKEMRWQILSRDRKGAGSLSSLPRSPTVAAQALPHFYHCVNLAETNVVINGVFVVLLLLLYTDNPLAWLPAGKGFEMTSVGSTMADGWMATVKLLPLPVAVVTVTPTKPTIA